MGSTIMGIIEGSSLYNSPLITRGKSLGFGTNSQPTKPAKKTKSAKPAALTKPAVPTKPAEPTMASAVDSCPGSVASPGPSPAITTPSSSSASPVSYLDSQISNPDVSNGSLNENGLNTHIEPVFPFDPAQVTLVDAPRGCTTARDRP